MATFDQRDRVLEAVAQLREDNNALLATNVRLRAAGGTITRIEALTAPQRTAFDAALVEIGIDVANLDAVIVSLKLVTDGIAANLTKIGR